MKILSRYRAVSYCLRGSEDSISEIVTNRRNMLSQDELRALQVLLQRVDLKGSEAGIVAQIQFKIQRMLEEPQKEADKLDKAIDEEKRNKKA